MQIRPKSNTNIEYILIADGSPLISTFTPPDAFKNEILEFIKSCPKDLIQIDNSLKFYELTLKTAWDKGYDFSIINYQDWKEFITVLKSNFQVKLIFLNGKNDKHVKLYQKELKPTNTLTFYYFYGKLPGELNDDRIVRNPQDFISKIISNQTLILKELKLSELEINPDMSLEYKGFNEFNFFVPSRNNYYQLQNIIGNFGGEETEEEKMNFEEKIVKESKKALKNKDSFERQQLFIDQIKKIDFFQNVCYQENLINIVTPTQPKYSPLILVLPFHNPDLKNIYKDKKMVALWQEEQTKNYTHHPNISNDVSVKLIMGGMELQRERIIYLDDVSFLHSSFSFSPIVRFPVKGKSIYRELSFFRTNTFSNFSLPKNRKKLKKSIYKFGKILSDSILSKELENVIIKRDGQIICISDLPVEWLLVKNIPLSFTHDICRLPETTLHGLMSFYTTNNTLRYSIPADVMKKTLVIMGTDEDGFKVWQKKAFELSKSKGFLIRECKKLQQVVDAVQELKPDILIFDCHGGFDSETRSTYLMIGNEKLDGDFLIKNKITAPIVFLSACGTAPTYGTMNPIANAFCETGALSVTSTFLSIGIDSGSVLYLRLLNNLEYASSKVIHKNWLNFVSHIIRTSAINDAYLIARREIENSKKIELKTSNSESLSKSMVFGNRRKLYHELNNTISKATGSSKNYFDEIIPEYLLYTNLGRGDLILFDSWLNEHTVKNGC